MFPNFIQRFYFGNNFPQGSSQARSRGTSRGGSQGTAQSIQRNADRCLMYEKFRNKLSISYSHAHLYSTLDISQI